MPESKDMSQDNAKHIESAIREVLKNGKDLTVESVQEILIAANITVSDHEFYNYLYNNHLYDWKKKKSSDQLKADRQAEERIGELEKTLSLIRATLESTADGIAMISREGKMVNWNQKFAQMFHFPPHILEPHNELIALQYIIDQVADPQELFNITSRLHDDPTLRGDMGDLNFKDGRIFERHSQPYLLSDRIVGRVWSFRDVTERRKQEQDLRLRERAIESSTHAVIITDNTPNYMVLYVNPAFERITGYSSKEIIGKNCFFWCGPDTQVPALQQIHLALKEKKGDHVSLSISRKDGVSFWSDINIAPVPGSNGEVTHFVWIVNDITEQKIMEEKLAYQATHDALTELPNRSLLRDRLQQSILQAKRSGLLISVWFIDLDRFKLTNDSLSHNVGDKLLQEVGKRLLKCVRETDTVARVGGDEFVIVAVLQKSELEAIPIANKILKTLSEPIYIDSSTFNVTASIGICMYPQNGEDADTLMKNADIAMYRAKDLGRDSFQFYTPEMNAKLAKRLVLENDLHQAIERNELSLNYQPLVNLSTGKIVGLEALLRWQHPEKGNISPIDFIPIAEESGLIMPIGEWVLETACARYKVLQAHSKKPLFMTINISSYQLKRSQFLETITKILKKTDMPPQHLELELTESILIDNTEKTLKLLKELKMLGVKLVIDDFGTGYSSLSYLKRFPLDTLKIDKSFVSGINTDASDAAIVQTIIVMAHILGLKVVAEGVETEFQLNFLKKHKCDVIQGYYFSRPLPEKEFIDLLEKNSHLQ